MVPNKMSNRTLAQKLHLSEGRIERLLDGRARFSKNVASRLSKLFGTTSEFWLNLQSQYEASIDPCPRCSSKKHFAGFGFASSVFGGYLMCEECGLILSISPSIDESVDQETAFLMEAQATFILIKRDSLSKF